MVTICPLHGSIVGKPDTAPAHAPQQLMKVAADHFVCGVDTSTPDATPRTSVTRDSSTTVAPAAVAACGKAAQRSRGLRLCSSSQRKLWTLVFRPGKSRAISGPESASLKL